MSNPKSGVAAGGPHYPQPNKDQVDEDAIRVATNNTMGRDEEVSYVGSDSDALPKGKK